MAMWCVGDLTTLECLSTDMQEYEFHQEWECQVRALQMDATSEGRVMVRYFLLGAKDGRTMDERILVSLPYMNCSNYYRALQVKYVELAMHTLDARLRSPNRSHFVAEVERVGDFVSDVFRKDHDSLIDEGRYFWRHSKKYEHVVACDLLLEGYNRCLKAKVHGECRDRAVLLCLLHWKNQREYSSSQAMEWSQRCEVSMGKVHELNNRRTGSDGAAIICVAFWRGYLKEVSSDDAREWSERCFYSSFGDSDIIDGCIDGQPIPLELLRLIVKPNDGPCPIIKLKSVKERLEEFQMYRIPSKEDKKEGEVQLSRVPNKEEKKATEVKPVPSRGKRGSEKLSVEKSLTKKKKDSVVEVEEVEEVAGEVKIKQLRRVTAKLPVKKLAEPKWAVGAIVEVEMLAGNVYFSTIHLAEVVAFYPSSCEYKCRLLAFDPDLSTSFSVWPEDRVHELRDSEPHRRWEIGQEVHFRWRLREVDSKCVDGGASKKGVWVKGKIASLGADVRITHFDWCTRKTRTREVKRIDMRSTWDK